MKSKEHNWDTVNNCEQTTKQKKTNCTIVETSYTPVKKTNPFPTDGLRKSDFSFLQLLRFFDAFAVFYSR